jgi:hypothetical protein
MIYTFSVVDSWLTDFLTMLSQNKKKKLHLLLRLILLTVSPPFHEKLYGSLRRNSTPPLMGPCQNQHIVKQDELVHYCIRLGIEATRVTDGPRAASGSCSQAK